MFDYIDVFKLEAKCFLKDFRSKNKRETELAAKYFSGKTDLSLMQAQHIVAKEYGFNSWDDLAKAERWDLAAALNIAQNKKLSSPLRIWYSHEELGYSMAERYGIQGPDFRGDVDLVNYRQKHSWGWSSYIHINNFDVSFADLSGLDISKATFDDFTIWPTDEAKMPKNFNPKAFLEKRKNPGLGIRKLHQSGIDGRGRNAAIISQGVLRPHLEYRDSLADYINLKSDTAAHEGANGGWKVALLSGKNCGVAPKAKVYYFAVDSASEDFSQFAEAIRRVCQLHEELKKSGKNGIDVVVLNEVFGELSEDVQSAIKQAESLGIFVNKYPYAFDYADIECRMEGDIDNPDDYVVHVVSKRNDKKKNRDTLCLIGYGQTVPCQYTIGSYLFNTTSCLGSFWLSGLFMLCRSVRIDLTPKDFFAAALETGDYREGIGVVVNPQRLIAKFKNK